MSRTSERALRSVVFSALGQSSSFSLISPTRLASLLNFMGYTGPEKGFHVSSYSVQ